MYKNWGSHSFPCRSLLLSTTVLNDSMCTRGLLDIYTLSPQACGQSAFGVYIRQTTRVHDLNND